MPDRFPLHSGDALSLGATEAEPKTVVNSGQVACYYGPGSALHNTRRLEIEDPEVKTLKPGERALIEAPTFFQNPNPDEATAITAIEEAPEDA